MTFLPPLLNEFGSELTMLRGAIASCVTSTAPSRQLDAVIARAVFPALAALEELEAGIWQQEDSSRVRALNYSRTWTAAATLVPPGCWIEHDCADVIVMGPHGGSRSAHDILPIALCLAALRARIQAAQWGMCVWGLSKETRND